MLCQTQASTIQKCIFFLQSLPWFGRVARHSLLDINHASCCLPFKDSTIIESWGNGNQIVNHLTHMRNSAHIVLGILGEMKENAMQALIYLHLIFAILLFEMSSLMNWIFSLFQTWILQATAGRKIQFKLEKKNQFPSNLLLQTWELQKSSADR